MFFFQNVNISSNNSFRKLESSFENHVKMLMPNDRKYSSRSPKKCQVETFSKKLPWESFTGLVECSLSNPVPGFPARRPILFGSESEIHIEIKTSFSQKSFVQTFHWTLNFEVYKSVPKFYVQNPNTTNFTRKAFSEKSFSPLGNLEIWQNCRKKDRQCSDHYSSESKIAVQTIFLSRSIFLLNLPIVQRFLKYL